MFRFLVLFCTLFSSASYGNDSDFVGSNDFVKSQYALGGIGLIMTPTARFSDDGEMGVGLSTKSPYNRLFGKVQLFPWMEAVVRYTEGTMYPYNPGSRQTWKDKGIDAKFRLVQEGRFMPELALGFNDLGGTGAFSSEFIAASKRFQNIDLTLGLGWGRLGYVDHLDNPLDRVLRGGFGGGALGGALNFSNYFSGETMSVFGGIEYFTPIPKLSVKLEYDTNRYIVGQRLKMFGPQKGVLELDTRFNVGLNYRLDLTERDKMDLSLGVVHGNAFYANFSMHSNLNFRGQSKVTMGAEELNQPYLEPYSKLTTDWKNYLSDLIMWQMGNAGFVTHRLVFNGNELQAEISQNMFQNTVQAIDLAARFLANNAPTNIDKITVINIDQGIETLRASIPREALVDSVANGPLDEELITFNIIEPLDPEAIVQDNNYLYPHFSWAIKPNMRGTLQHQQRFYFWQVEAIVTSVVSIKKGLYLTTNYGINILNNFDTYTSHIPDGHLYHVRQNRRFYLTGSPSGMRSMKLDYTFDLHPNVKGLVSAGYLEWMFGGYGGEILYTPDHKHWALGLEAWHVKQRDYKGRFDFLDYETVTGFLSFYYDLPFYDLRFVVNAGKFLGKDTGVHVDVSRRFDTGTRVGAIIAITNCDPRCVGEGSFNKWIYFEMPMDLYYRKSPTRGKTGFAWAPLTKDAAQRVAAGGLYGLVKDATGEVDSLRKKPWSIRKIIGGFGTSPKKKI